VFWAKMSFLACALIITGAIQLAVSRGFWDRRRVIARITAVVSLLLWVSIVAAGRWIAYMAHG
jgi:hypothetical protein